MRDCVPVDLPVRYAVRHTTTYAYDHEVSVSHHLVRLRPRSSPAQTTIAHALEITPAPALRSEHLDYYGNPTVFFTAEGAHRRLEVTAHSEVDRQPSPPLDLAASLDWETVREQCAADRLTEHSAAGEFRFDSPLVPRLPAFAEYAAASFAPGRPLLEAVRELTARIHADFAFDPKATTVTTPVEAVFKLRRGVCQDFAHFAIACLRSLDLPARYISGYLETLPPPGRTKLVGADASHAWLAVYCPGAGWIDFDPTNNLLPSDRHLTVAWGRDYSDVSPVRGVIVGGGRHALSVAVDVQRLAPAR